MTVGDAPWAPACRTSTVTEPSFTEIAVIDIDTTYGRLLADSVRLPVVVHLNGQLFGKPNAGDDMTFDFPQLIAHAADAWQEAGGG